MRITLTKKCMGRILLILFLISSILSSCDLTKEKVECSPVSPILFLHLVDKDSISQVGQKSIYNPDSIFYIINNKYVKPQIDSVFILLNTTNLDTISDKDIFLYLSQFDIDTIRVNIIKSTSECGIYYDVLRFTYNDIEIVSKNKRIYTVVK